jgi:hypothetical protein
MAWALVEGLAGVVDTGRTFDTVRLSPRWAAAGLDVADVSVGYEASGAGLSYQYRREGDRVDLMITGRAAAVDVHLLLPGGLAATAATVDGSPAAFRNTSIESSRYVDLACRVDGRTHLSLDVRQA